MSPCGTLIRVSEIGGEILRLYWAGGIPLERDLSVGESPCTQIRCYVSQPIGTRLTPKSDRTAGLLMLILMSFEDVVLKPLFVLEASLQECRVD